MTSTCVRPSGSHTASRLSTPLLSTPHHACSRYLHEACCGLRRDAPCTLRPETCCLRRDTPPRGPCVHGPIAEGRQHPFLSFGLQRLDTNDLHVSRTATHWGACVRSARANVSRPCTHHPYTVISLLMLIPVTHPSPIPVTTGDKRCGPQIVSLGHRRLRGDNATCTASLAPQGEWHAQGQWQCLNEGTCTLASPLCPRLFGLSGL